MASEEIDRADVDRLVQGLAAPPRPAAPKPAGTPIAAQATPSSGPAHGGYAPGRPFTTARLLMPPVRKERWRPLAFVSAINLPALPALPKIALPALPALPALSKVALPTLDEAQWGTLSVRTFVGLGGLLAGAMCYWPYANAWSWGLLLYLAAVMLVVVTGIWGAKLSWDARLPAAHTIAIGTVVWGLGLLAVEAVPRIGYV